MPLHQKKDQAKILFILHIPPPVHGSSIVGAYIKDSAAINDIFDCRFINLGTSKSIDEIGGNAVKKVIRYFSIILHVIKQLIFFKPDICYFAITAKGIGFYKDAQIALMIKMFRVKIIYHLHNKGVSLCQNKQPDDILYRLIFKKSNIILLSKHLYFDIQKYVPEKNVYYCNNGVHQLSDKTAKQNSKTVNFLFLSNLIESKGVYILLDACKILKKRNYNFRCNIVGAETKGISFNSFAKEVENRNLSDMVHLHGPKYGEEKMYFFNTADIFVFPTYNDCFPLVLIEAIQHGLPVVSTMEGGIPDIIVNGENGFLCNPHDVRDVAEKLENLVSDEGLRRKMGEKGVLHYMKNFTFKVFEKKMVNILSSVYEGC